jgi:hypothetical protein
MDKMNIEGSVDLRDWGEPGTSGMSDAVETTQLQISPVAVLDTDRASFHSEPSLGDDYDPADPRYIQHLPQSEVSALHLQLLQRQNLALQGVVAHRKAAGGSSDVTKHYEQALKATMKELESLSTEDGMSARSTQLSGDFSEAPSRFSRPSDRWDDEDDMVEVFV